MSKQLAPSGEIPPQLHPKPNETHQQRMVRLAAHLMYLGVSGRHVSRLLSHPLDFIEQQIAWLPYRNARKKASMIVAAIENNYEAPANWESDED